MDLRKENEFEDLHLFCLREPHCTALGSRREAQWPEGTGLSRGNPMHHHGWGASRLFTTVSKGLVLEGGFFRKSLVRNQTVSTHLPSLFSAELFTYPRHWWWCLVEKLCPALCNPMDCGLPGPPVHGIVQARVLEWAAIS